MVATDSQKLTLGDTTLTLYVTPGHTPGTISSLIPVKDNGRPHLVALWGGTGLDPDKESIQNYIRVGNESVRRYLKVAEECATSRVIRLN